MFHFITFIGQDLLHIDNRAPTIIEYLSNPAVLGTPQTSNIIIYEFKYIQ